MTQTDGRNSVNGSWLISVFTKKILWRDETTYKVDGRIDTSLFIGVTRKKGLNFQTWQLHEDVRLKCDCCFLRKHYNGKQLFGTSAKHTDVEQSTAHWSRKWEAWWKPSRCVYFYINYSRTRHRFILIQIVPLHICYMFRPVLRPSSGISIAKPYKGRYNKI